MDIQRWCDRFAEAVSEKFPEKWDRKERIEAIRRQLNDVETAGDEIQHRIACIFPDLFMLASDNNVNLESELQKVLEWFLDKDAEFSH